MSALHERECWIDGPEGLRLEGLLSSGDAPLAALLLHPHPQYGGDMQNHVVAALAVVLGDLGATTLRFNFRGVGRSTGSFDGGTGEAADAVAALDVLRRHAPDAGVLLAGYSFGAMVAASASTGQTLAGLLLVSPPLGFSALPPLPRDVPSLIIGGDRDPLAPAASIRAFEGGATHAVIVEGADHGWWPGLDTLTAETAKFAVQLIAALSDT